MKRKKRNVEIKEKEEEVLPGPQTSFRPTSELLTRGPLPSCQPLSRARPFGWSVGPAAQGLPSVGVSLCRTGPLVSQASNPPSHRLHGICGPRRTPRSYRWVTRFPRGLTPSRAGYKSGRLPHGNSLVPSAAPVSPNFHPPLLPSERTAAVIALIHTAISPLR